MVMFGIDISSHQGNIPVDIMASDFVIVKATEGTSYINPYCDSRYQLAKNSGKKLGVYHYAKNGNPRSEAEFFYNNIKGYVGEAILFLDYEEGITGNSPIWCRQFLDRLQELTGIKGMLYTYQYVINSQNWQTVVDGDYGLWFAAYGMNNRIDGFITKDIPSVPYWGSPAMYQYSSNTFIAGYGGRLDANNFYGDAAAWDKYASGKVIEPVKPKVEENEDMTEFAVVHGQAIHHVVLGLKVTTFATPSEWNLVQEVYAATHNGKGIVVYDWSGNDEYFNNILRLCNENRDDFQNKVTSDLKSIMEQIKTA